MSEQLRADAAPFQEARCGLPNCAEPLYMQWSASKVIYLSDTVADLADPAGAHAREWQIQCGAGHTIVLPPATAEDSYVFGECKCEPTDPSADEDCGHGDLDRLRAVLAETGG